MADIISLADKGLLISGEAEIDSDQVLQSAVGKIRDAVVLGFNKEDNSIYIASGCPQSKMFFMMDLAKQILLSEAITNNGLR